MGHAETLRRFNRTYTQRIGVLDESFLGLGMPLREARLVFEIGTAGASVRELRDRLGLDPGPRDDEGSYLVATSDGRPVACGGVRDLGAGIAEIKRRWVHPAWRGAGLGARLLRELEALAARRGHGVVRLDTNGTLPEAIAMYGRAGYVPIDRYNDSPYAEAWFEKDL